MSTRWLFFRRKNTQRHLVFHNELKKLATTWKYLHTLEKRNEWWYVEGKGKHSLIILIVNYHVFMRVCYLSLSNFWLKMIRKYNHQIFRIVLFAWLLFYFYCLPFDFFKLVKVNSIFVIREISWSFVVMFVFSDECCKLPKKVRDVKKEKWKAFSFF